MPKHICILQTSFAKREDSIAYLKERKANEDVVKCAIIDFLCFSHPTEHNAVKLRESTLVRPRFFCEVVING